MTKRIDIEREIQRRDPERDCERIVFLTSYLEFSWDMNKALELALFRTFAVPTIAALLRKTGQFTGAAQRRYDDTAIIINEIMIHGFESKRGQAFIEHMNRIHGHYLIKNDDFLYTLSTFVFVPIDWIDRFGWRKLHTNERLALFYFWREVGKRMSIEGIPETYEELHRFSREYEERMFANTQACEQIANATRDLLLSFYLPKPLWKPAQPLICALMDEPLLNAMGYPVPGDTTRAVVEGALRLRARAMRLMPKRKQPLLRTLMAWKTHPQGYGIEDIGPDSMRAKWVSESASVTPEATDTSARTARVS